jgi:hypothetical protein
MSVCNVPQAKDILQKSLDKAEKLSERVSVTRDGEVLSETIRVAKEGLAMLAAKDFASIPEVDRSALIDNVAVITLREHLTDRFKAAIGPKAGSRSTQSEYILKSAKLVDGKITMVVSPEGKKSNWTFTFSPDSDYSDRSNATGNRLYIPGFSDTFRATSRVHQNAVQEIKAPEVTKAARDSLSATMAVLNDDNVDLSEVIGSAAESAEAAFDYEKASTVKDYTHGSVQDMKNLLADLHATSMSSVTSEMYDYYDKLLDKMYPKFFRDMSVYINENEDHAHGWVNIEKSSMVVNTTSKTDSFMSNSEAYMHETIHSMTMWAIRSNTTDGKKLQRRLSYLRGQAFKGVTWKSLVKANPNLTEEAAKGVISYIFDSAYSDDEFLAYALTNPTFMKALESVKLKDERSTGMFNSLLDFFSDLIDAVMGNYDFRNRNANIDVEIHSLAFKLAEINAKADETVAKGSVLQNIGSLVDSFEENFEEMIHKIPGVLKLDSVGTMPDVNSMSRVQKSLFFAKFFIKGIYNPNYRNVVGMFFTNIGIDANNSIREIGRSVLPKLDYDWVAEFHNLATNKLDLIRNTHVAIAAESVLNKFKTPPTEDQENALTNVLMESNASTLFQSKRNGGKGYSPAQLKKIFSDPTYRKKLIARRENTIRKEEKDRGNWLVGQAKGLGTFMTTGMGHLNQNQNSRGIVLGHNSNERFAFKKDLHEKIEELAALHALDKHNLTEVMQVSELLSKEKEAVHNIVNLYEAFKVQSQIEFEKNAAHTVEGYSQELFDNTIDVAIEPMSKRVELEKAGFKFVKTLENKDLVDAEPLGYFVSDSYHQAERLKGAVSLGNPSHRGMTLKDMRFKQFPERNKHAYAWFQNDKMRLDKKAIEIHDKLMSGADPDTIETGPMPVLDATGKIIDYRTMMGKADKFRYLGQDKKISAVLAKTSASLVDKMQRDAQNDKVLVDLKKDIADVYDNQSSEQNLREYTLISPESTDPELREMFYMLPRSFQEFARNREDKSLPVPSILMPQYFGYKHLRFTDIPGLKQLPTAIKRVINVFETYFLDMIKIAKSNILMKMPVVLVGNLVSNILYAVNTGMPVGEIAGAYMDSFRDVKKFMADHKELEAKKVELAALTQSYTTQRFSSTNKRNEFNDEVLSLKSQVARLQKEMDKSEVKELFDLGMYQSVIEDVNMNIVGESNKISEGMDKLLGRAPKLIKTPLQWAYLSKETAWYKVNQEILQLSDLVARDVMNRKQKLIEKAQADGDRDLPLEYREKVGVKRKKLSGTEREEFLRFAERSRHINLLTSFVNYNLPNGRGEEFLNRIGVLMFTKYVKRIQQVITESSIKHPIRTVLTLTAAAFMFDASMIQEQSLIAKGLDDNNFGIFGMIPYYSPLDNFLNVVTPAVVKLTPY